MLNIDDLTVAQIKQVAALANSLGGCATKTSSSHPFVGKYVICRCYSAGVHAGELVSQDGDLVVLKNSRRLWSWRAKSGVALSGVAVHGLEKKDTKVDVILPEIALTGVIETIPCSEIARESINGF
jgi:hypothetical protein